MPHSRRPILRLATLSVLVFAFLMSGCGRKGPLDPPPGSSSLAPAAQEQSAPGVAGAPPSVITTDGDGRPLAPRGAKKRLPIDALID